MSEWNKGVDTRNVIAVVGAYYHITYSGTTLTLGNSEDTVSIPGTISITNLDSTNVRVNGATLGTSGAGVIAVKNGTEPATSPADEFQLYSVDISASNAAATIKSEGNTALVTRGSLTVQQKGGTLGTDEVQISHDGSAGYIICQDGVLQLQTPTTLNLYSNAGSNGWLVLSNGTFRPKVTGQNIGVPVLTLSPNNIYAAGQFAFDNNAGGSDAGFGYIGAGQVSVTNGSTTTYLQLGINTGVNALVKCVNPTATTGASVAGRTLTVKSGDAVASTDTVGAAAGGNFNINAGDAARLTSGTAAGGNVVITPGTPIGTADDALRGKIKLVTGSASTSTTAIEIYNPGGGDVNGNFFTIYPNGSISVLNLVAAYGTAFSLDPTAATLGAAIYPVVSQVIVGSDWQYTWGNAANVRGVTRDTGLARGAAGQISLTNGGATVYSSIGINGTTTYRSVATTGWGQPAIYGSGRVVGTVDSRAAAAATYTVGAADGSFMVSGNVLVTASATHSFSLDVSYTDEGNVARTLILPMAQLAGAFVTGGLITAVTGTGPYESVSLQIRAKASTAITIRVSNGTFTSVTYNSEGSIRQIA